VDFFSSKYYHSKYLPLLDVIGMKWRWT